MKILLRLAGSFDFFSRLDNVRVKNLNDGSLIDLADPAALRESFS